MHISYIYIYMYVIFCHISSSFIAGLGARSYYANTYFLFIHQPESFRKHPILWGAKGPKEYHDLRQGRKIEGVLKGLYIPMLPCPG